MKYRSRLWFTGLFLFLTFIGISLSSCFQIMEDIAVHADGSGTVTLTANLSESRTKLASVMLLDSVNGYKVPSQSDIREGLSNLSKQLSAIPGISNVTHQVNFDHFIAVIKFKFEKVSDLNTVMDAAFKEMKIPMGSSGSYAYDPQQKMFKRAYTYLPQAKAKFDKLKADDQAVFKDALYTSIYRFDGTVLHQTNKRASVSGSKQAVMLQTPIIPLIKGEQTLANQIQLSK